MYLSNRDVLQKICTAHFSVLCGSVGEHFGGVKCCIFVYLFLL